MGFAPTWLRQVSPDPGFTNHFNHCACCCIYWNNLCIIHCLQSESAIILEIKNFYELPDLWPTNSRDPINPIDYKIWSIYFSNESTRRKCKMWMIWCSVWLNCGWTRTERILTRPLTSGAGISMPAFEPQEDILNIHCDTYLSKTFKFRLSLL